MSQIFNLEVLENYVSNNNANISNFFNNGLVNEATIEFILSLFKNKIRNIPAELVEIYNWHNGVFIGDRMPMASYIWPDYTLLSLEDVAEIIEYDDVFGYRERLLFPLFSSFYGDNIALELTGKNRLVRCSTNFTEIDIIGGEIVMFDNLNAWYETLIELYSKDYICLVDEYDDGFERLDYCVHLKMVYKIAIKNNPKSTYWKIKMETKHW